MEFKPNLPPDIQAVIDRYDQAVSEASQGRSSLFHAQMMLEHCVQLSRFVKEQACIIHDLQQDSSAYEVGLRDGYEKRREDERAEQAKAFADMVGRQSRVLRAHANYPLLASGVVVGYSDLGTLQCSGRVPPLTFNP